MEVLVVPVAHVSSGSAERVGAAIAGFAPDVVAVELDYGRFGALLENRGPGALEVARHPLFGLLYLVQQLFGRRFDVAPGSEMLAAAREAGRAGIPVAFVDRPIGLTVARLNAIPAREKLSIALQALASPFVLLFGSAFGGKAFSPEALAGEALSSAAMAEFRRTLPNAYKALVEERDRFIASSVLGIRGERVVLVVGAGHVGGLMGLFSGMRERGVRAAVAPVGAS
ncbi:MAG: TraB/GumN family protein [Candidatus ainarchaeum sp.]|nr:TraB/GumN family protein [Candidatus ainarchaeum sp.]